MNVRDRFKIEYGSVEHHIFPEDWPFRQLPDGTLDPVYDYSSCQQFMEMTDADLEHWIRKITEAMRFKFQESKKELRRHLSEKSI